MYLVIELGKKIDELWTLLKKHSGEYENNKMTLGGPHTFNQKVTLCHQWRLQSRYLPIKVLERNIFVRIIYLGISYNYITT